MTPSETDLLASLIERKHDCLVCLRDVGRRQLELASEGSITGVLDVLSAKQDVIAKLHSIQRALDPFRNQDPRSRRWSSPERQRQCAERLQRCSALLAEILAQEKQSEEELVRRRNATAQQLQEIHRAGEARGAYTAPAVRQGHNLDLSSEG